MFLSRHYAGKTKVWTNREREAAQARALKGQGAYILPIRLDDTEIPGLLTTVAYLNWDQESIESITNYIIEKLRGDAL